MKQFNIKKLKLKALNKIQIYYNEFSFKDSLVKKVVKYIDGLVNKNEKIRLFVERTLKEKNIVFSFSKDVNSYLEKMFFDDNDNEVGIHPIADNNAIEISFEFIDFKKKTNVSKCELAICFKQFLFILCNYQNTELINFIKKNKNMDIDIDSFSKIQKSVSGYYKIALSFAKEFIDIECGDTLPIINNLLESSKSSFRSIEINKIKDLKNNLIKVHSFTEYMQYIRLYTLVVTNNLQVQRKDLESQVKLMQAKSYDFDKTEQKINKRRNLYKLVIKDSKKNLRIIFKEIERVTNASQKQHELITLTKKAIYKQMNQHYKTEDEFMNFFKNSKFYLKVNKTIAQYDIVLEDYTKKIEKNKQLLVNKENLLKDSDHELNDFTKAKEKVQKIIEESQEKIKKITKILDNFLDLEVELEERFSSNINDDLNSFDTKKQNGFFKSINS